MKKLFILTAAALAFVACSNDSDKATTVQNNDSVIRLITGMNATRGTNQDLQSTQMASGQSAWVVFTTDQNTALDATDHSEWTGSVPFTTSAAYTADGAGNLSGSTVHFPYLSGTAGTISLKAYAPFSALPTAGTAVKEDQTLEADYLASDYLYGARSGIAYSDIASPILITFNHMLAKIVVNVSSSDLTVSGAKVVFGNINSANVAVDYTINTNDGSVSAGTANKTVVMADAVGTDGKCAAIVVPQTIAANQKLFSVIIGSDTYQYQLSNAKTFAGGSVYTYNVSVRADGSVIILNETINQWTDGTTEGVIAG